ncbi:MAG: FMN-binding protein [Clostridiales bacterium]|nr:FMN-binding protein [Clostridiales bacterium]
MVHIISFIVAALFIWCCRKALKSCPAAFYIGAAILSALAIFVDSSALPEFVNKYIFAIFTSGSLAAALWCAVMWIGALPKGSRLMKELMPIRGELSIFTTVLTIGHCVNRGVDYIIRTFTESVSVLRILAVAVMILLLVIMLPLTVISVKKVRRKMDARKWKRIQCWAYLMYLLLYVHVLLAIMKSSMLGRVDCIIGVILYSVAFLVYLIVKIESSHKKINAALRHSITVCAAIIFAVIGVVIVISNHPTASNGDLDDSDITDSVEFVSNWNDGVYTADADGYDGKISAVVTIEGGRITSIEAKTREQDQWFFEQAGATIIDEIIKSQNTEVDVVAGSTYSSKGLMDAVAKALEQAEIVE